MSPFHPLVGQSRFCPPRPTPNGWGLPDDGGYVATPPTCGTIVILYLAPTGWGTTKRPGLCSQPAYSWAKCDFILQYATYPRTCAWVLILGDPRDGRGAAGNLPTCQPILILSPTPKGRGYVANGPNCVATLCPALQHCGSPTRVGDVTIIPISGPISVLSPVPKGWVFPDGGGCIANPPTYQQILMLSPALKRWEPSMRRMIGNPSAHVCAGPSFVAHC